MHELALPLLVGLIVVALAFDFLNGLHDAANSIATIVSTRVLRPQYAVLWAAFFNFVAFTVFGLHDGGKRADDKCSYDGRAAPPKSRQ